jgi:predicted PurR-regulated permease PerM
VTIVVSLLSATVLVCILMFMFSLPFYLGSCLVAVLSAVVALVQGRGFWRTLYILWPRVRF